MKKLFVLLLIVPGLAFATGTKKDEPVKLEQNQGQAQQQSQEQATQVDVANDIATASTSISEAAGGSAVNEGNSLSVESNYESGPADLVLVPNNNTESCLRVFGFAFGNKDASGMFGIPWRSAKCDYEQAADDAFAAGERDLGWFWKCQNKNLYKRFQSKGEEAKSAIDDCHVRMLATTSKDEVVRKLEERLEAAENRKEVCDESLDRCEDKVFGGK